MTRQQSQFLRCFQADDRFNYHRVSHVISFEQTCHHRACPILSVGSTELSTYRFHFAVGDRIIRAACVTRGEIRSTIRAADWTELISVAAAGSLTGRLEAGKSAKTSISFFKLSFKLKNNYPDIIQAYH